MESEENNLETMHWLSTGNTATTNNSDVILYEYVCSSCRGIAYFRKSMGKIVGGDYCPCCGMKSSQR